MKSTNETPKSSCGTGCNCSDCKCGSDCGCGDCANRKKENGHSP